MVPNQFLIPSDGYRWFLGFSGRRESGSSPFEVAAVPCQATWYMGYSLLCSSQQYFLESFGIFYGIFWNMLEYFMEYLEDSYL